MLFVLSEALEKICPHFDKLHAIAAGKPNVEPLFVSQSRGRPRTSSAPSNTSQLRPSDDARDSSKHNGDDNEHEEEGENVDGTPKGKSKDKAQPSPDDYKRSRGNKTLGFGDSLYRSNELRFKLQQQKLEDDARRWDAKFALEQKEGERRDARFAWEQTEAERRHAEAMNSSSCR
jgi:hypothetical protein